MTSDATSNQASDPQTPMSEAQLAAIRHQVRGYLQTLFADSFTGADVREAHAAADVLVDRLIAPTIVRLQAREAQMRPYVEAVARGQSPCTCPEMFPRHVQNCPVTKARALLAAQAGETSEGGGGNGD